MKRWIYTLNKPEAVREATRLGLDATGSIDALRRRLSHYVDDHPEMTGPGQAGPAAASSAVADDSALSQHIADEFASHAKAMNQIRKWGCHFDGRDPLSFLERMEDYQQQYRFSGEHMLAGLPELLRGDALLWYRNNRDEWTSWEDFIRTFRTQYLPRRFQARLKREIQERRQLPDESFDKYATALLTIMRRAGGFSTDDKVDRLYENLRAEYKLYIRFEEITDVHDLTARAREFEEIKRAQGHEQKDERRTGSAAVSTEYDRQNTYWRCKQRGHDRFNCRRPARKFCSQCGKDGVLTRDYHPRPGNGQPAGTVATTISRPELRE